MKAHTKETQDLMTPSLALDALKDGNDRFLKGNQVTRNLNAQVDETSGGQYPFATVLHCIDSRVSAEHVFDQGIGDLFSDSYCWKFCKRRYFRKHGVCL